MPSNYVERRKNDVATNAKNAMGYLFVKVMRLISLFFVREQRTILCVATTGLGDSLMITPAVKALKVAMPNFKVTLLVTESSHQVFAGSSEIDDFLFFRKGHGLVGLIGSLIRKGFRYSFIFHASDRLVWMLASAAAKTTVAGDWQPISIPNAIIHHWYRTPHREHRITSHLKLSQLIAPAIDLNATDMVFIPETDMCERFHAWLFKEKCLESKMLVGLFPGAKDRFKCWSIQNFLQLGRELERLDFQIVVIGGEQDQDLTWRLCEGLVTPLVFQEGLQELAALLTHLDCLVTNDSGPMHLALALKTPVVSLFGPTDDLETGPIQSFSKQLTVKKPVTCYPSKDFPIMETQCFNKKCSNPICINQISVAEVLEKILFAKKFARSTNNNNRRTEFFSES